jgi:hypothetical protein
MWLPPESMPDPADGHPAESGGLSPAARRALQGLNHNLLDRGIGNLARRPPSQPGLTACPMGQRFESILLVFSQNQRLFGSPGSHLSLLHLSRNPAPFSSLISGT